MGIRVARNDIFRFVILSAGLAISASGATLAPSTASVGPALGSGTTALTQSPAAPWTAVSSATWLTVAPASGSGNATLTFTFTANASANARQAVIQVAGQTFPVLQIGATGNYTPWGPSAYGQIKTLAGSGTSGYSGDGGVGTAATLSYPSGVVVDANGNVYFADTANYRIRRLDGSSGTIASFAGNGGCCFGGDNGPATTAQLYNPEAVALDAAGNLYIADQSNNRIRRVDAVTGTITTLAGSGLAGFAGDGGAATSAQLYAPHGVAVDGTGDVYVADTNNNRIRRIDASTRNITTVAGTGSAGFGGDGGLATSAQLYQPSDVAVDKAGNVYIADSNNNRIRRIDAVTAQISTVAGGGNGGDGGLATSASLADPQGMAIDRAGNLYLAETNNNRVRRVDGATGIITTVAGTGNYGYAGDGAPAISAQLRYPYGVALDGAGNLYITDNSNSVLRVVDLATPQVTLGAGVGVAQGAGTGSVGITISPASSAWFASSSAAWLTITTASGTGSGTINFSFAANTSATSRTASITVYGQSARVTQAGSAVTLSATAATVASSAGSGSFNLGVTPAAAWTAVSSAAWLTVTPASGTTGAAITYNYTVNTGANARTAVITVAGKTLTVLQLGASGAYTAWGSTGYGQIRTIAGNGTEAYSGDGGPAILASLYYPTGVAVDAVGNVFIADTYSSRIRRVDGVTGVITTVAGNGCCGFSGDGGPATSAGLNYPSAVAVDAVGNLYIADTQNGRIRRVDATTGTITTVAGTGTAGLLGDGGPATSARLSSPSGLAVDSTGNLYVADSGNNRIRRIDAITGVISTFGGTGVSGFSGDGGEASSAQLSDPSGLAVDSNGNVFVADQYNYRIRRIDVVTGKVTTVAGVGCCGSSGDGGLATSAYLYYPSGVAVDAAGDLYIADVDNYRIRRVDAITGIITTVAGSTYGYGGDGGPATLALLSYPRGVAVDRAGSVYIADTNNYRVRAVDLATPQVQLTSTSVSIGAASGSGSVGITLAPAGALWQTFSSASWLTLSSNSGAGNGTINYSFTANNSISTRTGTISVYGQILTVTQAGSAVTLSVASATIGSAAGAGSITLTVTPSAPWTAASSASWLTVGPSNGSASGTLTYNYTANTSPYARSAALTIAGKTISVFQLGASGAYTAWGTTAYGQITTVAGTGVAGYSGDGGAATAATVSPNSVAVEANGNVYVADGNNNRIRRVDDTSGLITTVAGNGTHTFADNAIATSGALANPGAVALDGAGNIYIADTGNNRVRRVDAITGALTTVAGNGSTSATGDGGPATAAGLNGPSGIAIDGIGNLFIADTGNYRIRRVDATTGIISTVAGSGASGFTGDGGLAIAALLTSPSGLTADAAGNLYISDGQRIRRVDALSGLISTVAGNGVGGFTGDGGLATAGEIYNPAGLALDAQGDLFIADASNSRVRRVDAGTGVITTVVGTGNCCSASGDGGPALAAQLQQPLGLAVDRTGNLYIADSNRVRFVDFTTPHVTLSPAFASVGAASGSGSSTIALSPAGASWVASSNSPWLTVTTASGTGNGTLAYSFTANNTTASRTGSITVYGQALLVTQAGAAASLSASSATAGAAAGSGSLSVTLTPAAAWTATSSAAWLSVNPSSGSASASLTYTYSANPGATPRYATLVIAGKSFVLFQTGSSGVYTTWGTIGYGRIRTIAGNGSTGATTDGVPATSTSLNNPISSALDGNGNVYIADQNNNRVRRVDAQTGIITTVAGTGAAGFSGDNGPANLALLSGPTGLIVDNIGNLLIADQGNNRIRRVDAVTGIITTIAGTGGAGLSGDGGLATSTSLSQPDAVALDGYGNVYISDAGSSRVRRVDASTGTVLTIAGNGSPGFSGDGGAANSAELNGPGGLAFDASGNLYIADTSNDRVRRVDSTSGIITTFAGNGCCGFLGDGGPATSALLNLPAAVALDASGNVFIADMSNGRIRRVDAVTGVISTVAGNAIGGFSGDNGPALLAGLNGPQGIAVDGTGNLVITDRGNGRVRVVDFTTPQVTLSAATASVGMNAGAGSVGLTISPPGAAWIATSSAPWLTLTSTSGAGNGTLNYNFSTNNSLASRVGVITVLGQTLTVTQQPATATLSPPSAFVGSAAGSASVTLTMTAPAAWTATSNVPWLTLSPSSGASSQTITLTYSANPGTGGRSAAVSIAGMTYSLLQTGTTGAYTEWGQIGLGLITTIAGTGVSGFSGDGGPATAAQLGSLGQIALDAAGNLYVPDTSNNRIRKVPGATGTITTVAGNGSVGTNGNGGPAVSAQLSAPGAVALDAAGNLYIADTGNNRIQRVDAVTGIMTTVAGSGSTCCSLGDGGPAVAAQLSQPTGLALDQGGDLYIADSNNYRIRRVDATTGVISTVAGIGCCGSSGDGGPATSATLDYPRAVALDGAGDLYIADYYNRRVRRVDAVTGVITTVAGNGSCCSSTGDGGPATSATLYPGALAVDSLGNLYIADTSANRIRRVDAITGVITTVAGGGSGGDGSLATSAQLGAAQGVAVDAAGDIYIADLNRVRFVDNSSPQVALSPFNTWVGPNGGTGSVGLAISPAGAAWTAISSASWLTLTGASGSGNGTITYSFAPANTIAERTGFISAYGQTVSVTQTGAAVSLSASAALASVTAGTGTAQLTVTPSASWTASSSAAWLTVTSPSGTGNATLTYTYSANPAANGRIATIVAGGQRLTVYQPGTNGTLNPWGTTFHGEILTLAGTGSAGFNGDGGQGPASTLNTPASTTVDANGNVYIADSANNRIRRVDATTGVITTIAGTGTAGFSGDGGAATSAWLNSPRRLAFDPGGNLYVADQANNRIRRIDAITGNISTVAGGGSSTGEGVSATAAQLYSPIGVAVDSSDNLYISDSGSNRIRFVSAATGQISTIAGSSTAGFSGDGGPAVSAQLNSPMGIALDSAGNFYFAEYYNNRIRRVDAGTGTITTFAGNGTGGFSGDGGLATSAQLSAPWDVVIDGAGNYFIADDGNRRVRRITGGVISTVAGPGAVPGPSGNAGLATAAQLNFPTGVAVDGAGNLYVAEYSGERVRFIDLTNPAGAPQSISFGALGNVPFSLTPITVSVTATSGLAVTVTSTTTSVCTVVGATVTLVGTGTCSLTATQAGNASYAAATPVIQSFNVTQASQTITFSALNNVFLGAAPFTVSATASSGLPVALNSLTSAVCTLTVATVSVFSTGTCSITASQAGNANYAPAAPVTRSFTVSPVAPTTIAVSSSVTPSVLGHAVTASATVLPAAATGKVTFYYGTSVMGTRLLSGGKATLATSLLPSGSQSFSAYYLGDAGHAPSSSAALPQQVYAVTGPGLATAVNYSAGQSPRAFAIADFNGDGKPDMAVANFGSGNVDVLAGNGDGTFLTAVPYPTDASPFSVVAGDFNGDGFVDLAVAAQSGNVDVLLGNGDGTFRTAVGYPAGTLPTILVAADFDHDGRVDLAIADSGANEVVILRGNGDGTFQAAVTYAAGTAPASLTAGDFNGDGITDLATANATSNDVSVLLGIGDGTFRAAVAYPADAQPSSITTGDFNGDGNVDLATANATGNTVSVLLGNGDGTFQAQVNYAAGTGPQMIATGDVDGDGNADLAIADNAGTSISVLLGNGNGTFQAATPYSAGTGPTAVAIADFNGDGRTDLAIANYGSNNVSIVLGNPPPTPALTSVAPNAVPVGSVATAMTLAGSNFVRGDTVVFTPPGGTATNIPPSLLQAAQIAATIPAIFLTTAGTAQVAVSNTAGTVSNRMSFLIGAPSIASLTPNTAPAGSAATAVTMAGLDFTAGSTVVFTPPGRPATVITPSLLQAAQMAATIPATLLSSSGTAEIAIANPGGTLSNQMPFLIVAPAVTSVNPGSVPAGSPATTVTVNGSNFTSGATLIFTPPGQAAATITPNLIQSAQLAATIPSTLLSSAGTGAIAIANGTGTLSNQMPFTISVPGTASQTISFAAIPNQTYGAAPFLLQPTATSGLTVSLASTTPSVCTASGGLLTILTPGTCTIVASQPGNASYAAAANVSQSFLISIPNNAVMLAMGSGIGSAGRSVEIPIQMTATGTAVPATLQADLTFDSTKLTFASARIGAAATNAAKTLSMNNVSSGDVRVLVAGLNQNAISNGVVVYASFTLNPAFTSGTVAVAPANCSSADGSGNSLVTPCTAGTIRYVTCDINGDGIVNVSDVQLIINEALGLAPAIDDLNGDGSVNVADVQKVINAALGLGCVVP